MGFICETKLKKTGISKTLKKFLLYYENVCFWEHFEEKRSHISKLVATLRHMIKRFRSRYIIILTILTLFGLFTYIKIAINHENKSVLEKLKNYKSTHSAYPKDLSQLDKDYSKIFYYSTDSLRQTFKLTYTSGIMNVNTYRYDSETGQWTTIFNY
jgi:hypothetical protein